MGERGNPILRNRITRTHILLWMLLPLPPYPQSLEEDRKNIKLNISVSTSPVVLVGAGSMYVFEHTPVPNGFDRDARSKQASKLAAAVTTPLSPLPTTTTTATNHPSLSNTPMFDEPRQKERRETLQYSQSMRPTIDQAGFYIARLELPRKTGSNFFKAERSGRRRGCIGRG